MFPDADNAGSGIPALDFDRAQGHQGAALVMFLVLLLFFITFKPRVDWYESLRAFNTEELSVGFRNRKLFKEGVNRVECFHSISIVHRDIQVRL